MRESLWKKSLRKLLYNGDAPPNRARDKRRATFAPRVEQFEPRLTPAAPVVLSINRANPLPQFTNAASVVYTVTFDQPVTGVDASDFEIVADSTLKFNAAIDVAGSGASYIVTVGGIRGAGDLRLDLVDDDSIFAGGLPLHDTGAFNGSFQGQPYILSTATVAVAPAVQSIDRQTPINQFTTATSATFSVVFTEPVTGVDITDFEIALSGTATGVFSSIAATDGSHYTVTVSGMSGLGEVRLNLLDDGTIRDADGNSLNRSAVEFASPSTIATGTGANILATGDFDRDGRIDLVTGNNTYFSETSPPTSVSVYLGNGDGTFKAPKVASLPPLPIIFNHLPPEMTVSDVNGDGNPDILTCEMSTDWVAILLGNGDGTFRSAMTTTAKSPYALAVADVNGDGKPDLVTTVAIFQGGFSVKLGNGDGTFGPAKTFSGAYYSGLAIADVNGDQKPDLVGGGNGTGTYVVLGNGDGTFRPTMSSPSTSTGPLTVADVNGDGKADLVTSIFENNRVGVLLGNGNGSFQAQTIYGVGDISRTAVAAIADLNRDGILDILGTGSGSNTASILLGNGNGTFQPQSKIPMGGNGPRSGVIADFNGDGRPDIATANALGRNVSVCLQSVGSFIGSTYFENPISPIAAPYVVSLDRASSVSSPTSATEATYVLSFSEPVTGVDPSDFQAFGLGTGSVDAVVALDALTYSVSVSGISGSGSWGLKLIDDGTIRDADNRKLVSHMVAFADPANYATTASARYLASADMNGDGKLDLATASSLNHSINLFLGNGNGTFQSPTSLQFNFSFRSLKFADVNGDGKPDLVFSSSDGGDISVLLGNGDGTFRPRIGTPAFDPGMLNVGDLNADGIPDLTTVDTSSGGGVDVFLGTGTGAFLQKTPSGTGVYGNWTGLGDFNSDGVLDAVAITRSDVGVNLMLGNGDGSFQSRITFAAGPQPNTGVVADVNGDGDLDIVIGQSDGNFSILYGNGDATFKPLYTFATNLGSVASVTAADINIDGYVDLFPSPFGEGAHVMLGNGDGRFGTPITNSLVAATSDVVVADFNMDSRPDVAAATTNGMSVFLSRDGSFAGQITLIDQTGPSTSLTAIPPTLSSNPAPSFGFTAVDPSIGGVSSGVNHFEYQLDSGNFIIASSPLSFTNLSEGVHTIAVRAVDNLGNVGAAASFTWSIDLTAPTATILTQPPLLTAGSGAFTFSADDPTVAGVTSGVKFIQYQIDGGSFILAASPVSITDLRTGNHTFAVRATDNAGNTGALASFTWAVDASPPFVQSITTPATITNATSVDFTVTFSEAVTGVDVSDFQVAGSSTASVSAVVAGDSSTYIVTISGISTSGKVGLNLVDNGSIRDAVNHVLFPKTTAFSNPVTYSIGLSPGSIATADFNGDGKADAVTANFVDSSLSVLLGNGDGTFRPTISISIGRVLSSVRTADINGDGKPDLVVSVTGVPALSVLLANGDGTFRPRIDTNVKLSDSFDVGDLNGDGKPDFVTSASGTSNSAGVYLGNGDGTFRSSPTVPVGSSTAWLKLADFNGDGKLDLVSSSSSDKTISLSLGNGDGTFRARSTFSSGTSFQTNAIADLDGDHNLDVITTNGSVRVLLGNGDGTFKPILTTGSGASGPQFAAIGDFDGNNKADLIAPGNSAMTLLLGNGDGTFKTSLSLTSGATPLDAAVADFNADGRADIAYVGNGKLSMLFNSSGTFTGQTANIDLTPPAVSFAATPKAISNRSTTSFGFNGFDPVVGGVTSGVNHFESQLDSGNFVTSTTGQVTFNGLSEGSHSFGVRAVDNAGNKGPVTIYSWIVDLTAPTLAITPNAANLTSSPATFTFSFSEPVTGFTAAKIAATNGVVGAFAVVDSSTYTLVVMPAANGPGSVSVAAGTALDLAGNGNTAASAAVTYAIPSAPTTTTLSATPNATTGGTLVTLTATVSPSPGAFGSVAFMDNNTAIPGGSSVALVGGVAVFTTSTLAAGSHPIHADFSGALGFAGSSSTAIDVVVTSAPTTTTLASVPPNSALPTQAIAVTVTVAGGGPTNGENVTLFDTGNVPVPATGGVLANGTATLTIAPGTLAVGMHNLVAVYAGNAFNIGSQSAPVSLVVAAAPQVVGVSPNVNIPGLAGSQRSRVANVVAVFDQPVQLDANALTLALHTNNVAFGAAQPTGMGAIPTLVLAHSVDNTTWTMTFSGANTETGPDGFASLVDGVYDFNIDATKVHPLGVPGINMAANSTTTFHRLYGDTGAPDSTVAGGSTNYTAVVNSSDNLDLLTAFNKPIGGGYQSFLDFDGDGNINSLDNLSFLTRFNKSLTWRV